MNKKIYKNLYIFFSILFIFLILFSTNNLHAKNYKVKNINIITPYNLDFKKDAVMDKAFSSAFELLMLKILNTKDFEKVELTRLNVIKDMIISFEIIDEKFVNENYSASINVLFDKKKILSFLDKQNLISSIPNEKKILFIPIIIDLNNEELLMYEENKFFKNWNLNKKKHHLINYVLPDEDIDVLNLIKKNQYNIENYDFKEITEKYNDNEYIISIFFKNLDNIDILTKIKINKKLNILKLNFKNIDLNNVNSNEQLIDELKNQFENIWKKSNQINPSIKLPITVSVDSKNLLLIKKFEDLLVSSDFVSEYFVEKISSSYSIYRIIYNSTPDKFLSNFETQNLKVDISGKIWEIKNE